MNTSLILASASPRRLALLAQIGITPTVQPTDIDESPITGETGIKMVRRLARAKCESIDATEPVLAADTVVIQGTRVFGKPESQAHAIDMLLSLSGSEHTVATAVCIRAAEQLHECTVNSVVTLTSINEDMALRYWQTGEPSYKAGSYAIQGMGAVFVERLVGSYSNVMGLPLFETAQLLSNIGLDCFEQACN